MCGYPFVDVQANAGVLRGQRHLVCAKLATLCGCCDWNLDLLQEQSVLVTLGHLSGHVSVPVHEVRVSMPCHGCGERTTVQSCSLFFPFYVGSGT